MKAIIVNLLVVLVASCQAFSISGFFGSVSKHAKENVELNKNQATSNMDLMHEHMKDFKQAAFDGNILGTVQLLSKNSMNMGKTMADQAVQNTAKYADDAVDDAQVNGICIYLFYFR